MKKIFVLSFVLVLLSGTSSQATFKIDAGGTAAEITKTVSNSVEKVKKKFDPERTAKNFLKEMFIAMGLIVNVETKLKDRQLEIKISGDDMGIIIGKRGQTLDAVQYLVNLVVNKGTAPYISVTLDTENYRERRKETLETLAFNLAKKVKHTGKNVVLEPMNPYERRIIHSALQNDRYVTTYSEGDEPYRNVVITLKEKNRRSGDAGNR